MNNGVVPLSNNMGVANLSYPTLGDHSINNHLLKFNITKSLEVICQRYIYSIESTEKKAQIRRINQLGPQWLKFHIS